MLIVGIDPPNGIATMDGKGRLLSVKTSSFWEIADTLAELSQDIKNGKGPVIVYVEAPQANKSLYARFSGKKQKVQGRIAQNVGANKQTSQLLIERCRTLGIPCFALPPRRHNATKNNPEEFRTLTGWQDKTSSHGRDAAALIWHRNWKLDLQLLAGGVQN